MTVSINGTSGLVFNDASTQNTAATGFGFKNRLINSAMVIDQRNAGASVTNTGTGNFIYTVDRWAGFANVSSKFSTQQNAGSVTPPAGFKNYLGATSLSSYSVGAGEYCALCQPIEGFNTADLSWGTSSASTVTLSFWVRSSLTGTFGGSLGNYSGNRSYPFVYTISVANTWEQKSITIAGDTTGTWQTGNTGGIYLYLGIGIGSTYSGTAGAWAGANYFSATGATSVVGTNGATFYLTGVQLEKGSTATSFDYRPYGTELQLCQRYYQGGYTRFRATAAAGSIEWTYSYATTKRAAPTVTVVSSGSGTVTVASSANTDAVAFNDSSASATGNVVFTVSAEL